VSKAFAVAVDKTLMAVVIVLYTPSSWTFEHDLGFPLYCLEFSVIDILALDVKPFRFHLFHELPEIVSMILHLRVASHKVDRLFLVVLIEASFNQHILKYALG
jgi:hypothetical protein